MKNYKSILITGASSGLGKSLAIEYANKEVYLFLTARNREKLEETANLCKNLGAIVFFETNDIKNREDIKDFVLRSNNIKKLDLIIANAGISIETCDNFCENSDRLYDVLNTNIFGVINTVEPIIPEMIKNKSGQIAIISSMSSFVGLPSCIAYSSSKACISAYGEALRGSLKQYNIGVSTISPGFIKTPLTDKNKFQMPLMISSEKAAKIIKTKLSKNKGLITFPIIIYFLMKFLRFLPYSFTNYIISKFPKK